MEPITRPTTPKSWCLESASGPSRPQHPLRVPDDRRKQTEPKLASPTRLGWPFWGQGEGLKKEFFKDISDITKSAKAELGSMGHGREGTGGSAEDHLRASSLWLPPYLCVKLCKLLIINEVLGINSPLVSKLLR